MSYQDLVEILLPFENLIGLLAAVISFTMFLPQALKTWEMRNKPEALEAVSSGTQFLIICNALLWGLMGVIVGSFWVAAPGLVNLPLAVFTLYLKRRSRKGSKLHRYQS